MEVEGFTKQQIFNTLYTIVHDQKAETTSAFVEQRRMMQEQHRAMLDALKEIREDIGDIQLQMERGVTQPSSSATKAASPPPTPCGGDLSQIGPSDDKNAWGKAHDIASVYVPPPARDHGAPSINFNQLLEKEKLKGNGSNFTDCLEAELQKRFEHHDPCEMMRELKLIFETHAAVESYEASKQFFNRMMEEGSSVSEHIYKNFVMNYNVQNMNKELPELFSMLKSAEVEIKKENQVLMVNKTTVQEAGKPNKGNFKKGGKKVAASREA
ncbi:hypothetical protein QYE76_030932 [Lolium multiflorum]|uniref:Uncharacterized protein n=1 Tax=Lolium multiflorum TaxID=4521 RepID=A0AAD8QU10_LOLMU|nr:hypothetical protein QYE76_030932 [Lolium multiflorum]